MKLYGSTLIADTFRIMFFRSLVVSRLIFNLHIFVVKPKEIRRLNHVYMRGLRRIHGDPRFSANTHYRDAELRERMSMPSIDCVLSVARWRYVGRVVRNRPLTLISLLHFRKGEQCLPWVRALQHDAAFLQARGFFADLPSFDTHPPT
eukprot:349419-Pyramimonas_sp.AAC.1